MKENGLNIGLLIFRLSFSTLMLLHGLEKIKSGIDSIKEYVIDSGLPVILSYGVYIGEIIAPLLIFIGFRTRIGAGILAVNCVAAALLVHGDDIMGLNPQTGAWVLEVLGLYFFAALGLIFTGGGKYSVSTKSIWD